MHYQIIWKWSWFTSSFLTPIYDRLHALSSLYLHRHCRYCIKIQCLHNFFYRTQKDIFSFPICIFFLKNKIQSFPTPSLSPHWCSLYIVYHHWFLWYILYHSTFIYSCSVYISYKHGAYYDHPYCNWCLMTELFQRVFHSISIFIISAKFL